MGSDFSFPADISAVEGRVWGCDYWIVFAYTCREYRASWILSCCKIRAINVSELPVIFPFCRHSPTRCQDPTWNCLTNHCGVQFIHWLSQCCDSLCSTTVALIAGMHGASHGSRLASLKGRLASTQNPSCDSPHVGSTHVLADVRTNICARAPLKRDSTPLPSVIY